MKALSETRIAALRAMPYADYLQTPEWRQRRDRALARALWCCEWPDCRTRRGLEVHHKCYDRVGEELDTDLAVLCHRHHSGYHERWDVRLVMIRATMREHGYASFADFIGAVKDACRKHNLQYNDAEFREAVRLAEHDLRIEAAHPPPRVLELDETPPVTTSRARELLNEIRERTDCALSIKAMPKALLVTPTQAAQMKAAALVLREIEASVARCRALDNATDQPESRDE